MPPKPPIHPLTPIIGTLLFTLLYFTATLYYPGGSSFDKNAIGFSWAHNYWCNLLNDTAINGQPNTAQPIALAAMVVLCGSMVAFWLQFPQHTHLSTKYKRTIQISGTSAMATGLLLYTKIDHDLVTNAASLFGLIATTGTFIGLYKNNWKKLFYFGLVNLLLVVLNNILYYNEGLIAYLPVVQKITFAAFLTWVCCISFTIIRVNRNQNENRPYTF